VKICNIIIGTANFGSGKYGIKNKKKNSGNKIKSIIDFAKLNGINRLDTSIEYKGVYRNLSKINLMEWKVSSKFTLKRYKDDIIKKFSNDFNASLKKLKIRKYDVFSFHNIDDLNHKNITGIIKLLKTFKKKNLINKIGVSLNDPNEIKIVKKKFKPDIIQLPFNLLDRRILNRKLLKECGGIEIQVRSIFLQGLLLMNYKNRGKNNNREILLKFDKWINLQKIKRYQACINFINNFKFFKTCVIGVNTKSDICQFLKAIGDNSKKFPKEILSNNLNLIEPRKWKIN